VSRAARLTIVPTPLGAAGVGIGTDGSMILGWDR